MEAFQVHTRAPSPIGYEGKSSWSGGVEDVDDEGGRSSFGHLQWLREQNRRVV